MIFVLYCIEFFCKI